MELKEITTRYLTAFESKELDLLEGIYFLIKLVSETGKSRRREKRRYCPQIARFSMSLKI